MCITPIKRCNRGLRQARLGDRAIRRDHTQDLRPPGREGLEMDSALSPREIQARIRSGASVDDVAAEAGVSTEQVEPFAVPVLAELDHVVEVAMDCPVRRHGDPGSHRGLGSIVAQVCRAHDMDVDAITWRCWRHQDRSWAVVAGWEGDPGPGQGQATFRFDLRSRYSVPQDVGARWLVDDRVPLAEVVNEGKDPDKEPTIDLHDDLAIVRAVSDRARPSRHRTTRPSTPPDAGDASQGPSGQAEEDQSPQVPGMTSTDGVYDFVPSTGSQMDMLYEMLAGFQEDSVNIYEGFSEPVATPVEPVDDHSRGATADHRPEDRSAEGTGGTDGPEKAADDEPSQEGSPSTPDEPEEKPRPGGRRKKRNHKRASIPSWDEIMFGGPGSQN
ncbi:DUF3071 domain-containing protein [Acidipropionibacterium acidipropionici]|nr:DUF3071 domain-containing protein [Acidipropionibacterium acidipropionici]